MLVANFVISHAAEQISYSSAFQLIAVKQGKGYKPTQSQLTMKAIKMMYILNLISSKHVALALFYIIKKT